MNRPWHPQPTEAARDFYARYAPTRAATMADVWSMTAGPTARFINRHGRKICAAAKAYKETV
jgi:hypothetical protein